MGTHSSIPSWEIQQIEEPGGLQSTRSQSIGFNSVTKHHYHHEHEEEDTNSRAHILILFLAKLKFLVFLLCEVIIRVGFTGKCRQTEHVSVLLDQSQGLLTSTSWGQSRHILMMEEHACLLTFLTARVLGAWEEIFNQLRATVNINYRCGRESCKYLLQRQTQLSQLQEHNEMTFMLTMNEPTRLLPALGCLQCPTPHYMTICLLPLLTLFVYSNKLD